MFSPLIWDAYLSLCAVNICLGFEHGCLIHLKFNRPLLDFLLGAGLRCRKILGHLLLIFRKGDRVGGLGQRLFGHVHIGSEDLHLLSGRRQLGFELLHLIFIRPAVELEQRLAFLHRHIRLDQHRRHQRRLAQTRRELDGVLDDPRVVGGGRHEPQADHEDEQHMQEDKCRHQRPGDAKLQPLELEENQPDKQDEPGREGDGKKHGAVPLG